MPLVAKTKIIGTAPPKKAKEPEASLARPEGGKIVTKKFSLEAFKAKAPLTRVEAPKATPENTVSSLEGIRRKRTTVQLKQPEEVKGPEQPKKVKIQRIQDAEEIRDAALVVNGQKRKLSKNSAYMLDMVSLDDE